MARRTRRRSPAARALYHLSGASVLVGTTKVGAKVTANLVAAPLLPLQPFTSRPGRPGTERRHRG